MTPDQKIALAGIITGCLTPLAVVFVGYWIGRQSKRFENGLSRADRLTGTRFELYKDIGFKLNDLYAYYLYVGLWKSLSCHDVIDRKRELDRHFYTYKPLFSDTLFEAYDRFIAEAFSTFGGWGKDAALRTGVQYRPEESDKSKHHHFTNQDNRHNIIKAYNDLMKCLATDLGLSEAVAKR
jgi:hypothetical protein